MRYFIESIAGMLLVGIIMLSTLFFSNSQNETDVMRVKSEINDANFLFSVMILTVIVKN